MKNDNTVWDYDVVMQRFGSQEAIVKRLATIYLRDIVEQISLLDKALAQQNIDEIVLHAHSISGMSANMSVVTLHQLAKEIETTAHMSNLDTLNAHFKRLKSEYEKVNKILSEFALS